MATAPRLSASKRDAVLATLQHRFDQHMSRHPTVTWATVRDALTGNLAAVATLAAMEESGGEPDVVVLDPSSGAIQFVDCSAESPAGRRSLCYDKAALDARKEAKPKSSAMQEAAALGVTLLTEAQYRMLQTYGPFDRKTSSWIATPPQIRALGGALFCDRRYDAVFLYHNGAESYYAARGFRGVLTV